MFYVSVDQIDSRIFHRYVADGKHHQEILKELPLRLWIKGKKRPESHYGLMHEILNPIDFTSISDAKEFFYQYKDTQDIYGQTNFAYQFISNTYPDNITFDFSKINVLIIDIETAFDDAGFPTPEKANQEILSITCKLLGKNNKFVSFGTKELKRDLPDDVIYHQCRHENNLLSSFLQFFQESKCDIITGWNCSGFDIPYIINRCNKVLGESVTKRFSPFYKDLTKCIIAENRKDNKGTWYRIVGISDLDYLDLYKQYSYATLESYRLDVVGQHELGEGKVDYSDYKNLMDLYEKDFDKYLLYNIHDVRIVENLEYKLNFLFLATTIAYLGKIRYNEIYSQVRFWDNYIYNELLQKNIQIPPNKKKEHKEIVGAYVKDPIPNLYEWVVTLDLTSLYPSIIMSFNMSPETQVDAAHYSVKDIDRFINMDIDLDFLRQRDWTMVANGACFRRDNLGIMPALVEKMFSLRKLYKSKMISAQKKLEENTSNPKDETLESQIATYSAMQMAYKISMNSLYGASANKYFRYYNSDVAEGITMTGQLVIRYISERLNVKFNEMFKTKNVDYIIFNDTDSAGLNFKTLVDNIFPNGEKNSTIVDFLDKFVKKYINPYIAKEYQRLADYLNVRKNGLFMNREVIADRGLWRAKKNYVLQIWDKEGIRYQKPKLKMMGIETAKSSTPQIVRGSLEEAIKIILNEDEKTLRDYVKKFKIAFFNAPIEQIAFPRGVSDIDKWIIKEDSDLSAFDVEKGGKYSADYYLTPPNPWTEDGWDETISGGINRLKRISGDSWKKGTPIHVKGCIIYNSLLKKYKLISLYPRIKNGDKIKFIYLKTPNPYQSNVVAFLDVLYSEFGLDKYIDKETQFSKTFMEPLSSFLEIVKWNVEKQSSLDFFMS